MDWGREEDWMEDEEEAEEDEKEASFKLHFDACDGVERLQRVALPSNTQNSAAISHR
jgi:hypothetical protein